MCEHLDLSHVDVHLGVLQCVSQADGLGLYRGAEHEVNGRGVGGGDAVGARAGIAGLCLPAILGTDFMPFASLILVFQRLALRPRRTTIVVEEGLHFGDGLSFVEGERGDRVHRRGGGSPSGPTL